MNAWLAPLANPCAAMCRRVGHWGTRKGPAELDREGGWSIPERARSERMSAQRDEQKLADGLTGRPTAFALSPGPKEGVTRTHMGPMEQDHMATRSQNHLPSYPPVCLRVSALYSFFFFFKAICTKAYTSFADTGKIWINRAFL